MSDSSPLTAPSSALEDFAHTVYDAARDASQRIVSNLRVEAIRLESGVIERFFAYMEMGLDRKKIESDIPLRMTAIAFTDRQKTQAEVTTGADLACFIRYDLPGLRWAKGFLGQSKIAQVNGLREDGVPIVGLRNEQDYEHLIQECVAMRQISDESYVFFYTSEGVTVEKASNLLADSAEAYSEKPWRDVHQFRKRPPVDIAQFYAALAACQLGDTLLDKPIKSYGTMLDLIAARGVATVLLMMVGTIPPQPPVYRESPEVLNLPVPVPETYWLWPDLMHVLMNR